MRGLHLRLQAKVEAQETHRYWAKSGEYVAQVTAMGPLRLDYFERANDPAISDPARSPAGSLGEDI